MTLARARRVQAPASVESFENPTLDPRLRHAYGNDLLTEFVAQHNSVDVLRELVQNEFDAGGTVLRAEFREASLRVTGNGSPVDASGWRRLSVMLSTGQVSGPDGTEQIDAKESGIGSKNLGLRSLFLIGDRIYIRSNGKSTLMDLAHGTLPKPDPHPASVGSRGIEIIVPYRSTPSTRLQAFTPEAEALALDRFSEELAGILIKLAQPGSRRNLTDVIVTSVRHNRRLSWTQVATNVRGSTAGVRVLRRTVRRYDAHQGTRPVRSELDEMEFQRIVSLPAEFPNRTIPTYFRAPRGQFRIAVSVRMRGERLDPEAIGQFYYPLAARDALTATAVSACAPFAVSSDRSAITEELWNSWLQTVTAALAIDLLPSDWFRRFGPDAFEAVLRQGSRPSGFQTAIEQVLRTQPCWPTNAPAEGRPTDRHLARAPELVLPTHPAWASIGRSEKQKLEESIEKRPRLVAFALAAGAKAFGLDSLVRLRCAGRDAKGLATKPAASEWGAAYPTFPAVFEGSAGLGRQKAFGRALDVVARHLSAANRKDLETAGVVMAADGSLHLPGELWHFPSTIGGSQVVSAAMRLHPELSEIRTIVRLCKPFKPGAWLEEVCQRAQQGKATEPEVQALFDYLRETHGRMPRRLLGVVRRSPVVRDHRGDWISPASLTARTAPGAEVLEPVLHFPHADIARDPQLLARLAIRRRVKDDLFLEFAETHIDSPEAAERFEDLLSRRRPGFSKATLVRLGRVPFLRSSRGELAAAVTLYLRNVTTLASLGTGATYVQGSRLDLYRRLGCADAPRAEDIGRHLADLRKIGQPPERMDLLYPALASALVRDGKATNSLADEPIIWTGSGYDAPADVLIARRLIRPLALLPHAAGSEELNAALLKLGCHPQPLERHWRLFFERMASRYPTRNDRVSAADRTALLYAYGRRGLSGLPADIGEGIRCLLSRQSTLHSIADVRAGHLLFNDFPALADAVEKHEAGITFPDRDEASQAFFHALNLKSLAQLAGAPVARVGKRREAPSFLRAGDILTRLHGDDFASALTALSRDEWRRDSASPRPRAVAIHGALATVTSVDLVEDITLTYRVGRARIEVDTDVWMDGSSIWLARARSYEGIRGLIAMAIASVGSDQPSRPAFTDAVFRLLSARGSIEMAEYLNRRGIDWRPSTSDDEAPLDTDLGDALQTLTGDLLARAGDLKAAPTPVGAPTAAPAAPAIPPAVARVPLPPLDKVTLTTLEPSDWRPPKKSSGQGGGGAGSGWLPPTPEDTVRDIEIGQRAEELIYRQELGRLRGLGLSESRVVWTSAVNPGADHDILSVDDDGEDLWIEVKGTTGTGGGFAWSVGEFARAARERSHYVLWRVYLVGGPTPKARPFRDPVGMLADGNLRLDIATLAAQVAPLE